MKDIKQTELEHAYTIWVKIQEQTYKGKANKFDGDELKEIETFNTVSTFLRSFFFAKY